jgi:chromosome segregation ATPase
VERLKQELSRAQKLNSEHTSQVDKLKKQHDSLEAKLQETRKQNIVDQVEIKELRAKLRVSENERGHLALKSEESGDTKKSLAALETKRKEELLERDKRIVEPEKSVANERRRNGVLEGKLLESEGRTQRELDAARKMISTLRGEVVSAEEDVASTRIGAGQREEELIAQLDSARAMIHQVAHEYGKLASLTVPKASHESLKQENHSLQLNVNRLQKKYAVADLQAKETAELLRVSREQTHALDRILKEVWADLDSRISVISGPLLPVDDGSPGHYTEVEVQLATIALDESARRNEVITARLSSSELFAHWYKTLARTLLHDYSLACTELSAAAEENQANQNSITVATTHVSTLSSQLEAAKLQTDSIQRQAGELSEKLEAANGREASLKEEMAKREKEVKTEKQAAKDRLERERETSKHLQTSMERQRFAEEEMRNEIYTYVISASASLSGCRSKHIQIIKGPRGIGCLCTRISDPHR